MSQMTSNPRWICNSKSLDSGLKVVPCWAHDIALCQLSIKFFYSIILFYIIFIYVQRQCHNETYQQESFTSKENTSEDINCQGYSWGTGTGHFYTC